MKSAMKNIWVQTTRGPDSIDGINLRTLYLWHAGFVPEYPEYPQYSGISLP